MNANEIIRCAFAGNRFIPNPDKTKEDIWQTAINLIENHGVTVFWVGNYGTFDRIAAHTIYLLKKQYPHIRLEMVIPYLTQSLLQDDLTRGYVDEIFVADIPPKTPRRFMLSKANQYMVANCQYLIAYVVNPNIGGAAQTMDFARRKKKMIMNLGGDDYRNTEIG